MYINSDFIFAFWKFPSALFNQLWHMCFSFAVQSHIQYLFQINTILKGALRIPIINLSSLNIQTSLQASEMVNKRDKTLNSLAKLETCPCSAMIDIHVGTNCTSTLFSILILKWDAHSVSIESKYAEHSLHVLCTSVVWKFQKYTASEGNIYL